MCKSKDAVNLHLVATEPSAANGSLLADEHDDDHCDDKHDDDHCDDEQDDNYDQ